MSVKSDAVLRAAVGLFAQHGFAATGIRDVGRAANINSATLYHYAAGGKQDLLVAVMRLCLTELLRGANDAVDQVDDPERQLSRLVRFHVALSATNPRTARVTDQEMRALTPERRDELLAMRDAYEGIFASVLADGVRSGAFRLPDERIARLALLEMCNGVANWYRPGGRLDVLGLQDLFAEYAARLVAMPVVPVAELGPSATPNLLPSEPREVPDDAQEAL